MGPSSSSPRPPSSTNGARGRWPIDADAPWKSHGRLRRTARTEPSTALSTELGKPANGCRFPTSVNRPAALRRVPLARSSLHHERNIQSTEVRRWQHSQPVHPIGAGPQAGPAHGGGRTGRASPTATSPLWRFPAGHSRRSSLGEPRPRAACASLRQAAVRGARWVVSPDAYVMVVSIETQPVFRPGTPRAGARRKA